MLVQNNHTQTELHFGCNSPVIILTVGSDKALLLGVSGFFGIVLKGVVDNVLLHVTTEGRVLRLKCRSRKGGFWGKLFWE